MNDPRDYGHRKGSIWPNWRLLCTHPMTPEHLRVGLHDGLLMWEGGPFALLVGPCYCQACCLNRVN